ncbi:hypothetical protein Golomagni_05668 [Golovinomyces magnicellulatus]|nr:hypothetical protein Golomagni_05668 [Golovinomyces magnicellulatus]
MCSTTAFMSANKIVGDEKTAFSTATFQGLLVDSAERSRSRWGKYGSDDKNDRLECPCGKYHNISYGNYLNPKRSRPQWWKPNKQIKEKIERYFKRNLDFARKVKLEIEEWEAKRASNNSMSKY